VKIIVPESEPAVAVTVKVGIVPILALKVQVPELAVTDAPDDNVPVPPLKVPPLMTKAQFPLTADVVTVKAPLMLTVPPVTPQSKLPNPVCAASNRRTDVAAPECVIAEVIALGPMAMVPPANGVTTTVPPVHGPLSTMRAVVTEVVDNCKPEPVGANGAVTVTV